MIVTVFRSRLDPKQAENYAATAKVMAELVSEMPGLISYKAFEAKDGERVTIVEFEDEASHNAWRDHPKHQKAMDLGKTKFYEEYKVQVCNLVRESTHQR
jgi:heme-degrading monooxygenase HmoA